MSTLPTTEPGRTPCQGRESTTGERHIRPAARALRPAPAPVAADQRLLAVRFQAPDGRSWHAIGGGATVAAAIIFARDCCPHDAAWSAVSWNDLYGD
jgi:hypothetical protein